MLRKIWIVLGAVALVTVAYLTAFAVEEVQNPLAEDAAAGGAAEAATWTVCSSGCDFTSIQAAVDAASDGDTIELGAETYQEHVVISCGLTIRGVGQTETVVEGDSSASVFRYVANSACASTLRLSDMTIRDGRVGLSAYNGPFFLDNLLVSNNAEGGVYVESLGGDWVGEINDSTIIYNGHAPEPLGQARGGVDVLGTDFRVTVRNSTIVENKAVDGGGINLWSWNFSCELPELGGCGPYFNSAGLSVQQSTIAHNTATRAGGGIAVWGGGVGLWNSTVTGNRAPLGGGIMVDATNGAGFGALSSTIANNEFGGIVDYGGWGFSFDLWYSIVAGNTGGACPGGGFTFFSFHSLSDDDSCIFDPTDLVNTDPLLLPLADNGGPTPTHALAPGSPAIDVGGDDCPWTDQRGVARPKNGDGDGVAKCDIGAYEVDVLAVNIDIKPDDYPNSVNPYARGVLPVAILGNDTTDVADIDVTTLVFGPAGAPIAHLNGHLQDVNYDGIMDLMLHFRTQDTGIACGDESATLTGETLDGQSFEGTDSIQTVGCHVTRRPAIWMKDQDRPNTTERNGFVNIERK